MASISDDAAAAPTGPDLAWAVAWLRRVAPLVLAAFLGLGLAARARQYAATPSFWYDEAYLLVNVSDKSWAELCGPLRCDQAAPPLFLWALRGLYLAAGPSEWAMRLPAFLAGVAAAVALVPLARRVAGPVGAAWAVGFCLLSRHAVGHSVEVKPYSLDLFTTTALLWAAAGVVAAGPGRGVRRGHWAALFVGAAVGPWLSYPSGFVLGGVSLALAWHAWGRADRRAWAAWVGFNAVALTSVVAVWAVAARHQRTASLEAYWRHAFIDLSSAGGAARWVANYLVQVGDYGTTSLGIPLAVLAAGGLAELWRRCRPLVFLLAGPPAVALVPNALGLYPLDDRLLFFAAPCVWLAAAAGVDGVVRRLRGRGAWVGVVALAALHLPGGVLVGKNLVIVEPKAEYREAFDFVRREGGAADLCWVMHPEVAEVYLGGGRPWVGSHHDPAAVAEEARGKGLWLVTCLPEFGPPLPPELVRQLSAVRLTPLKVKELRTVAVFRCVAEGGPP